MNNALHQARTGGSALLLTEFGAETNVADLREVVGLADQHGISWLEWAYCACGDPTGSGQAESLVRNAHRPPRGANLNSSTLRALDEPYPQVVSGTPLTSSFDPATRTFHLRYTTRSPTGRRFGRGARSRIYLPRLQYGSGYHVLVRGGRAVSKPNATVLVIATGSHRHAVTVTVRPAGRH